MVRYSLLILAALILSCRKHEVLIFEPEATACITTKHHTWNVPGLKLFIKYHSTVFEGWNGNSYDDSTLCSAAATGCLVRIPVGSHLIMAKGFDSLSHYYVKGARQIEIKSYDQNYVDTVLVSE